MTKSQYGGCRVLKDNIDYTNIDTENIRNDDGMVTFGTFENVKTILKYITKQEKRTVLVISVCIAINKS